jgi:hypothetical protein
MKKYEMDTNKRQKPKIGGVWKEAEEKGVIFILKKHSFLNVF